MAKNRGLGRNLSAPRSSSVLELVVPILFTGDMGRFGSVLRTLKGGYKFRAGNLPEVVF